MRATDKLIALFLMSCMAWPVAAQEKWCAVILLHDKWELPQSLMPFGSKLDPECASKPIEMPWSNVRSYDEPYPTAISEIKVHVAKYRQQGARKVILAGQGFGANAAIAYMTIEADVDGLVAISPGHMPGLLYQQAIWRDTIDKAKNLVSDGKGDEHLEVQEQVPGKRFTVRMRANVLSSYFDPKGLGNMQVTAAKFKKSVPVLWVMGIRSPMLTSGTTFAFDKMPQNDASQYLLVNAGHRDAPEVAATQVLHWLKSLQ